MADNLNDIHIVLFDEPHDMQRGRFKQKPPEFGVHLRAAALEKPAVRVIQGNDGRPASRVSLLVDCTKPVAVAPGRATTADIRSHMTDIKTIKEKGLDLNKVARDAAITASVDKAVVPAGSATPEHVTTLIERGLKAQAPVPTPGSDSPLRCGRYDRTAFDQLSAEFVELALVIRR